MKKKIYESPALMVTKIETEDIILVSSLITVISENLLGQGTIDFSEIDLDTDL